jgi:hypothetical protein
MNRYPEQQEKADADDRRRYRRVARLRPGDTVTVQALQFMPETGRVLLSRVSEVRPDVGDAVLVSTRGHGRRWFHTHGHPYRVVEEISQ